LSILDNKEKKMCMAKLCMKSGVAIGPVVVELDDIKRFLINSQGTPRVMRIMDPESKDITAIPLANIEVITYKPIKLAEMGKGEVDD
jgi:hypothetical protein